MLVRAFVHFKFVVVVSRAFIDVVIVKRRLRNELLDRVGVDVVNDRDFFSVGGLKVSLVIWCYAFARRSSLGLSRFRTNARRRRRARGFWSSPLFFVIIIMDSSNEQRNLHFAPPLFTAWAVNHQPGCERAFEESCALPANGRGVRVKK